MNFSQFKTKYEKSDVKILNDATVLSNPLVSICVQTYQHKNYIGKCIESILSQETNFTYEILIGEDDSKDGTREICENFAKLHPGKIKLFLHKRENNIEINGGPTGRFNFAYNLYSARGKYIALCEGDDYWTDPLKLQKQVNQFEERDDIIACYTNAWQKIEGKKETITYVNGKNRNQIIPFSQIALIGGGLFPTASLIFKNCIQKFPEFFFNSSSGDRALSLLLADKGDFKYLSDITCIYRIHEKGVFTSKLGDKRKRINIYESNIKLIEEFDRYSSGKHQKHLKAAKSLQAKKILMLNKKFSNLKLIEHLTLRDALSIMKNILFT